MLATVGRGVGPDNEFGSVRKARLYAWAVQMCVHTQDVTGALRLRRVHLRARQTLGQLRGGVRGPGRAPHSAHHSSSCAS